MLQVTRENGLPVLCMPHEDQPSNTIGGIALHGWGDVGVDLSRDVGAAVVEALADDLDVDTGAQGERCPRVAEAVERDRRDLLIGVVPVEVALVAVELAREPLGMVRPAVGLAEHVAVVVVAGAEPQLRLGLLGAQLAEHRDGAGVEADQVSLLRLRELLHDHPVIKRRDLAGDDRRRLLKVDVAPTEAEALAARQPLVARKIHAGKYLLSDV